MNEIIQKMLKIENTIYGLYEKLISSTTSNEYEENKELLKQAIKTETRIFDELNNITFIEGLNTIFNKKLDDTMIDECFLFEIPIFLKKNDLINIRILEKIGKKYDEINPDVLTLKEYKKIENCVEIPGVGEINLTDLGINKEYIDNNDGVSIKIFNKIYYIDFKKFGLKEENYVDILKEGVMLNGKLLYFHDDIKPDIVGKYSNKAKAEIILKFLNKLKKINYRYVYKLMFNNEYLENILLNTDFNIDKSLDIIKFTTRENDQFYNYLLKLFNEKETLLMELLCCAQKPKYDLCVAYLKTMLEYKTDEELEEINYYFNNRIRIFDNINNKGYNYVKKILDDINNQKIKQLH